MRTTIRTRGMPWDSGRRPALSSSISVRIFSSARFVRVLPPRYWIPSMALFTTAADEEASSWRWISEEVEKVATPMRVWLGSRPTSKNGTICLTNSSSCSRNVPGIPPLKGRSMDPDLSRRKTRSTGEEHPSNTTLAYTVSPSRSVTQSNPARLARRASSPCRVLLAGTLSSDTSVMVRARASWWYVTVSLVMSLGATSYAW